MPAAVVNASLLIFLSKLEQLDALQVFSPVLTTSVVLEEVEAGLETGYRDALGVQRAVREGRIAVRQAPALRIPAINLDPGELSVVALANAIKGAVAVVDDLPAIRVARQLGVTVRSTPFVLLENVARGRIAPLEFRELLARLVQFDYHMKPSLYAALVGDAEAMGHRKE